MEPADRQRLDTKYHGEVARQYEARRRSGPHWAKEQAAAEEMLRRAKPQGGFTVLDIPVGTGRFCPIYERLGAKLIGLDISSDMLEAARASCERAALQTATLEIGDAFDIALPDRSVDIAVCVRFMQHVDFEAFRTVMAELKRVSRNHILLGIHLVQPHDAGWTRLIRAALFSPRHTFRRLRKAVFRRRSGNTANRGDDYMERADKNEAEAFSEFRHLGLEVIEEREILTSLHPRKSVSYRFLLLRRTA